MVGGTLASLLRREDQNPADGSAKARTIPGANRREAQQIVIALLVTADFRWNTCLHPTKVTDSPGP